MPAIASGKVLVTGANGFIAVWVVKDLLEHGFSVRGTVRSESKATYLRELFAVHGDRFEIVIVENFSKEDAFDAAVDGVNAVMHLASPVNFVVDDLDYIILPAVHGMKNILRSALKPEHRARIQRVLVMSSTAALCPDFPPPGHAAHVRALDERDWNSFSVEEVRKKGRNAPGKMKYDASKTLAERAAWDVYEQAKAEGTLGWDLVVLNPPWVFGPILHEAPTVEELGLTPRMWYDSVVKGQLQENALTKNGYPYVDVRDLADAHLLGLTCSEAGGERFIICSGHSFVWQHFIESARRLSEPIPNWDPSFQEGEVAFEFNVSAKKSQRVLGIKYRTMEETTKDTLGDLRIRGWF